MPKPIYIIDVPEMISKWDYKLNRNIDVSKITVGNENALWWKCEKGHSYPSTPDSQRHGSGCSVCAGKYVLKGVNDLETWCHLNGKDYLLSEWNYTKNKKVPSEYASKSGEYVNWICRFCGNEWSCAINSRTGKESACKNCVGSRQTSFPEQAIAYYAKKYFDSVLIHYNLGKTKYTIDVYLETEKVGIEYDGIAWHSSDIAKRRELEKNEYCNTYGIRLIRIKESDKEQRMLYDADVISFYRDRKDTHLNEVISFLFCSILRCASASADIDVNRDRNSILENYYVDISGNSLSKKHPELLKEWDYSKNSPLDPQYVPYRSNAEVWWICPKGHSYLMSIDKRSSGRGCKYCYGTSTILEGFSDFETWCNENGKEYLLTEWDYCKNDSVPKEHRHGEKKEVYWKCPSCGNEWTAKILTRAHGYKKCSICFPSKRSKRVVIRNIENGIMEEFDSIGKAADFLGVSFQNVSKALKEGGTIGKYRILS